MEGSKISQHIDSLWGKISSYSEERRFLEGPQTRRFELWRSIKIFFEFLRGFRKLHFVGPCVTVFGSARFSQDNQYYQIAREVGRKVGEAGFTIVTGGGPGIMEAANRGAKEAGAYSVGCNIVLPQEQKPNAFLDLWMEFEHFFVRKVMLIKYSYAFVALPGGFGTLDEIFETATLVQTGKIKDFPIILVGKEYWRPLIDFFVERLLAEKAIDRLDFDRITLTDSVDEVLSCIKTHAFERFGLKYRYRPRPLMFFFEKRKA